MASQVERVRTGLVEFVTRSFMVSEEEIAMDESLVDQGIIDSFGLVEITAFLEKEFNVTIREEEMTRDAFGSMNKIAAFVAARLPDDS